MAAYFNIPDEVSDAVSLAKRAAAVQNHGFRELLVIYLGGDKLLPKLVIDDQVGRAYSSHSVLYRTVFDQSFPGSWPKLIEEAVYSV